MIGSGLRCYHHAHHRNAIHLHIALEVGRAKLCVSDIAYAYNIAVTLFEYYVAELLGCVHLSHCAQGELYGVTLDAARRELDILACYGVLYIYGSNAVSSHFDGVEPDAHRVAFLSPYAYAAHIGNCLQLLFHGEVGNFAELK